MEEKCRNMKPLVCHFFPILHSLPRKDASSSFLRLLFSSSLPTAYSLLLFRFNVRGKLERLLTCVLLRVLFEDVVITISFALFSST